MTKCDGHDQITYHGYQKNKWFMYGKKHSKHAHCIICLSQVLLSQVGSLFFFVLFFTMQLVNVLHHTYM